MEEKSSRVYKGSFPDTKYILLKIIDSWEGRKLGETKVNLDKAERLKKIY
jgi:hypothetical protein